MNYETSSIVPDWIIDKAIESDLFSSLREAYKILSHSSITKSASFISFYFVIKF